MRAGPLSSDKVIKRLNADFVNTWTIIPWFENPDRFFEETTARQWSKVIEAEFSYPVDSIILSSDGKPLSQAEFSQFHRNRDPAARYLKMLDAAK